MFCDQISIFIQINLLLLLLINYRVIYDTYASRR